MLITTNKHVSTLTDQHLTNRILFLFNASPESIITLHYTLIAFCSIAPSQEMHNIASEFTIFVCRNYTGNPYKCPKVRFIIEEETLSLAVWVINNKIRQTEYLARFIVATTFSAARWEKHLYGLHSLALGHLRYSELHGHLVRKGCKLGRGVSVTPPPPIPFLY